jgi:hypothetical protein
MLDKKHANFFQSQNCGGAGGGEGGGIPYFMMYVFVMEIYHLIHKKHVPKLIYVIIC